MCDQDHFDDDKEQFEKRGLVTRRQFGVLLGAGMTMVLPKVLNAVDVTDAEVMIKTPDGTAEAYFVRPATGTGAGVLLWPDIFGLRPAMRQMAKRLAENGYAVLVPNPFYRQKKANEVAEKGAATPIPQLIPLAQALSETTHMTDARAFIAWMDQQQAVAKNRQDRHAGLLHGRPDGLPHRRGRARSRGRRGVVPRRRPGDPSAKQPAPAGVENEGAAPRRHRRQRRQRAPNEKNVLKETFAKTNQPAEIEVYTGAAHGWCPPDSGVYNEPQAEKAWARLLALYGKALA